MTTITIKEVIAQQSKLAAMIEQLRQAAQPSTIQIDEAEIELQAGERYAGAVLDDQGQHKHHLVLMAERPDGRLTWQAAMEWAASVGGELPDRQEQALLFANCKPHLEAAWHWSSVTHEEDASYAWYCGFYYGTQHSTARAMRAVRLPSAEFDPFTPSILLS